jgi:alanine racemase
MAVLKSDAYGHGIAEVSRTLHENGISHFAVATYSEAMLLRTTLSEAAVLILGYTPPYLYDDVIAAAITPTIFTFEDVRGLSHRARALGAKVKIHLKIDTGMHRLGFAVDSETVATIKAIGLLPHIEIEGIYTHFATAHSTDKKTARLQFEIFTGLIEALSQDGLHFPLKHVSNSATILDLPGLHLDMVRTGILLYGLFPSYEVKKDRIDTRETLSVKAEISQIKSLNPGEGVGYGLTYRAKSSRKIATLSIGYTDMAIKKLENRGYVLVNGKKAPIVGTMSMDQMTVDVTNINTKQGDVATLIGHSRSKFISTNEVAALTDAPPFLVICSVNKRLPRKYIRNGSVVKIEDLNLNLVRCL